MHIDGNHELKKKTRNRLKRSDCSKCKVPLPKYNKSKSFNGSALKYKKSFQSTLGKHIVLTSYSLPRHPQKKKSGGGGGGGCFSLFWEALMDT